MAPNCLGMNIAGMTIVAPKKINTHMTPIANAMLFCTNVINSIPTNNNRKNKLHTALKPIGYDLFSIRIPTSTRAPPLKNGPQKAMLLIVNVSYSKIPYPIDVNMLEIKPPVIVEMIV